MKEKNKEEPIFDRQKPIKSQRFKLGALENFPRNELIVEFKGHMNGHVKYNIQENVFEGVLDGELWDLNPKKKQLNLKDLATQYAGHVKNVSDRFMASKDFDSVKKIICDGKVVYDSKEWDKLRNPEKIIVLDTETTGFKKEDEVLQLTVLNGNGKELFNEYFKPNHTQSWESAEKCNHISPKFVADKPSLLSRKDQIESLLKNADVIVGYNPGFDIKMLEQNGIAVPKDKRYVDIMIPYAEVKNVPNEYGKPKWFKLMDCAKEYGFPEADFHNSLGDTKATLHCYQEMMKKGQLYEGDIKDPAHLVGYNQKEFNRVRGVPEKPKGIKRPASKGNSLER